MNLKVDQELLKMNLNGRMERVPRNLIANLTNKDIKVFMDVGHNPDGIQILINSLKNKYQNIPIDVVFGTSSEKKSREILKILNENCEKIYCVQGRNPRIKQIKIIQEEADKENISVEVISNGNINQTLRYYFRNPTENRILLVCGSFFIMDEVRIFFKFEDERDFVFLNEYRSF